MYEWLEQELAEIKTRKFHVTGVELPPGFVSNAVPWPSPPPPSFSEFIRRFGSTTLYRELGYYLVRIYNVPIIERSSNGQVYLVFGGTDSGIAGFRPEQLSLGKEAPVWGTVGMSGFHQKAESFEKWIEIRAISARKHYTKKEWKAILEGPAPFSTEEIDVIRARAQFQWRLLGSSESGALRFEMTNNSDRTLPYLSIGIRGPNLIGGVALNVASVMPGETAIVEHNGFRKQVDPIKCEAFSKPDPEPEDREYYWEFRSS